MHLQACPVNRMEYHLINIKWLGTFLMHLWTNASSLSSVQGCCKFSVRHICTIQRRGKGGTGTCVYLPVLPQALWAGELRWLSLTSAGIWKGCGEGGEEAGRTVGRWPMEREVGLWTSTCAGSKSYSQVAVQDCSDLSHRINGSDPNGPIGVAAVLPMLRGKVSPCSSRAKLSLDKVQAY